MFPFLLKYLIKAAFSETSYKSKVANSEFLSTRQERVKQVLTEGDHGKVKQCLAQRGGFTVDSGVPSQGRHIISVFQRRYVFEFEYDLYKNHAFLMLVTN